MLHEIDDKYIYKCDDTGNRSKVVPVLNQVPCHEEVSLV